jgi:hypothetical protein
MVMDLAVRRHSQIGSGYQMGSQLQQPGPYQTPTYTGFHFYICKRTEGVCPNENALRLVGNYQDTLLSAKRGCGDVGC